MTEQLPAHIQVAIDQQVQQLQATLIETMALAKEQGCGVRVEWRAMDSAGRMQFEMKIDPTIPVDGVVYKQLDAKNGDITVTT